ncbi:MAG TPA: hypothetical protein PK033_06445 [Acetivibrio sp.]|nr:hypothetical protein [Clostridium sp.]HOQ37496.1 hypothetical protein [Acetivibrio sp.]HQA57501.1 hypothetical protein [Acetivibrio sp.]
MGVLCINYSELSNAIKNAENAAKRADSYAKELNKKVCKKSVILRVEFLVV